MLLHEVENSSEDLKVDTIIIDEASMIDINLLQIYRSYSRQGAVDISW